MKKVVLIGGKAGSGKNTVAEIMKAYLENQGKKVMILGNGDTVRNYAKQYFNLNNYKASSEGRQIMQGITNMLYDINPFYFEEITEDTMSQHQNIDIFIISDWRYPNTHTHFTQHNYEVIGIYLKRESVYSYSDVISKDKSEREETLRGLIDYTIYNSTMTLNQLRQCVEQYTEVMINGKYK